MTESGSACCCPRWADRASSAFEDLSPSRRRGRASRAIPTIAAVNNNSPPETQSGAAESCLLNHAESRGPITAAELQEMLNRDILRFNCSPSKPVANQPWSGGQKSEMAMPKTPNATNTSARLFANSITPVNRPVDSVAARIRYRGAIWSSTGLRKMQPMMYTPK